jgi:hypothetical protein
MIPEFYKVKNWFLEKLAGKGYKRESKKQVFPNFLKPHHLP